MNVVRHFGYLLLALVYLVLRLHWLKFAQARHLLEGFYNCSDCYDEQTLLVMHFRLVLVQQEHL